MAFWNSCWTDYRSFSGTQLDPWLQPSLACEGEGNSASPSKWTLQRASRHQISGVTLLYFINKIFTSEKCPTPKYFTWTAIHMCVGKSARSSSSSSYPFKECKVKKFLKITSVTSLVIALVFVSSHVSDQRWTTEHFSFSDSSHQLPFCFGCWCYGFGFGGKQAGNRDNPCSGKTTLL